MKLRLIGYMYLTENWRLKDQRLGLKGNIPKGGDKVVFPPRPVQPRDVELFDFSTGATTVQGDRAALEVLASNFLVEAQN